MRAIFNIFHVFQLKKCLRVLEERVEDGDIKLKSDLAYEEMPVQIIDSRDSVTWNCVIKFHKVMWNNHSEQDAMWESEDYLREVDPTFYKNGRSFESRDEISMRGRGYNTLGVRLTLLHLHCMSISIIHSYMSINIWNIHLLFYVATCVCFIVMLVNASGWCWSLKYLRHT